MMLCQLESTFILPDYFPNHVPTNSLMDILGSPLKTDTKILLLLMILVYNTCKFSNELRMNNTLIYKFLTIRKKIQI